MAESRSRFVRPESDVLRISRGDTLTVKRRLNTGEQRAMFTRMSILEAGTRNVDPIQVGPAKVAAYLLAWSLTDDNGNLVDVSEKSPAEIEQVLNALDPDDFKEIREAVEAHIDATDAARAEEKKLQGGEPASSTTSSSPATMAGATSG